MYEVGKRVVAAELPQDVALEIFKEIDWFRLFFSIFFVLYILANCISLIFFRIWRHFVNRFDSVGFK